MLMRTTLLILVVGFYALMTSGCGQQEEQSGSVLNAASSEITPMKPKENERAFCGKRYETKRQSSCGVQSYKSAVHKSCGLAGYKSGRSMSCPGSITADSTTITSTGNCQGEAGSPGSCPAGYRDEGVSSSTKTCRTGGSGRLGTDPVEWEQVIRRERRCVRDARAATCELPQFGERYKTCRTAANGVELYKSCDVEVGNKKCKYYAESAQEVSAFLDARTPVVKTNGRSLYNGWLGFHEANDGENSMACIIKTFEAKQQTPDLAALLVQLREDFEASFGHPYAPPTNEICATPNQQPISQFICADDDRTRVCREWHEYSTGKTWLEVTKKDAANLLVDPVIKNDDALKKKLKSLIDGVVKELNLIAQ